VYQNLCEFAIIILIKKSWQNFIDLCEFAIIILIKKSDQILRRFCIHGSEIMNVADSQRISACSSVLYCQVGCQSGAAVRSMFEINISAGHLLRL
jgi:hypothetical protein